jgi:FkbM family methyltransferase
VSQKTFRHIKRDLDSFLPNVQVRRAFDVGGNVGQTVAALRASFPASEIWTFEPVATAYRELVERTRTLENVHCFNVALGSSDGRGIVTAHGSSPTNHVITESIADATVVNRSGEQEVEMATGDSFCLRHGVETINYLKIDTEGHELQVLRGFHGMLGRFAIELLELEVGMNWDNRRQVPMERVKGYLEPMGYYVFRFYEQVAERRGRPHLRRADAVFLSRPTIEANIRPFGPRAGEVDLTA